MSYKTSTAIGFRDFVRQIRNFVCGYGEDNNHTYSGAQDTPKIHYFGAKYSGPPPGAGPAVGTWEIECTTPGATGVAQFSVKNPALTTVGTATAGTYFDHAEVSLLVFIHSSESFIAGDKFTIDVTGDAATYTADEYWQVMYEGIPVGGSGDDAYFQFQGKGLTGDKTINVLMHTNSTGASNIFTIDYRYATGYLSEPTYNQNSQPGVSSETYAVHHMSAGRSDDFAGDISMTFHIFSNAQRFIVANESSAGKWHGAYNGFFFPYGSPGQYAFPYYAGANCREALAFTSSSAKQGCINHPSHLAGYMRQPGGSDFPVSHFNAQDGYDLRDVQNAANRVWPRGSLAAYLYWEKMRPSEFDNSAMFHAVIRQNNPEQVLGELDGVCVVPVNSGAVDPGTTITDGVNNWVIFRHPLSSDYQDHFAVRID